MRFEWDAAKAASNLVKHGLGFQDAASALGRGVVLERSVRAGEERWLAVGPVGHLIVTVIFPYRYDTIRIISARRTRPGKLREYRAHLGGRTGR